MTEKATIAGRALPLAFSGVAATVRVNTRASRTTIGLERGGAGERLPHSRVRPLGSGTSRETKATESSIRAPGGSTEYVSWSRFFP